VVIPRIAVIGFDGMELSLVHRWAGKGHLPTFARLLEASSWTQFRLPPEYSSGMVWPSINTGLEPSVHQTSFGLRLVEGTYRLRPRRHQDVRGIPFWHALAARGRRLVLMDVPFARVDPACSGMQIIGWGQHEWGWPRESHPRRLLAEVERAFGRYPLTTFAEDTFACDGADALLNGLLRGTEQRTRILCHLTRQDDWDLFYGVFHEAHGAGHYLWHLSDTSHPLFERSSEIGSPDPLLRVYSALDRSLQKLIEHFGKDVTVMVILSHGMGPNYSGDHLFAELLTRFNRSCRDSPCNNLSRTDNLGVWDLTIGKLPPRLRKRAQRHVPPQLRRWLSAKRHQHRGIWRHEESFALPGLDGFSAVRVNLAGREPDGVVHAGRKYDEYLDAMQAEFRSWTVGSAGQKAVARVHRAARGLDALRLGVAPDLMVWWNKARPICEIRSPALGEVRGNSTDERTGEHVMHSLVLLRHPEGSVGSRSLSDVGITDIASIVRGLAGFP
jgi:predicted AlkP superfamily phosphohydrolase/phosphomutase